MLLILIGGHFALAPRAQKEAAAAKAAGFRVVVRGVWWDTRFAAEDLELAARIEVDVVPIVDLRERGSSSYLFRFKQRLARLMYERLGIVTSRSMGIGAQEMLREVMRLMPDLTMVHSEAGLWVGNELLRHGFRVGVDFEDWFSEDLPQADRKGRPVAEIKRLERKLLSKANPVLTTTRVMAEAMAADAEVERVPTVIPNCFPWSGAPVPGEGASDERDPKAVSFYWFSQTIGPGRGLETLANSLSQLRGNWELHLRGNMRAYGAWFESVFPTEIRDRVKVHAPVPNLELAARSASHDVGLALEVPYCPNKNLTASNKIFEYLRCGLAVIATSTQGQLEVMESCPDAGWVIPPDDPVALAEVMQRCLHDRSGLAEARSKALAAADRVWAWERFETKLGYALLEAANA